MPSKSVRVIGIAIASGTPGEVRSKVEELRVKYPVLLGTDQVMSDFDVDLIEQEINTLLAER